MKLSNDYYTHTKGIYKQILNFSSGWLNVFWISRHKRTQTTTKKHNCKKPLTIQNVNTRSNFPKTKSASKDQIRILAHEKNKKQGITSSKNKKDNIISLDNNKKQKILFQKNPQKPSKQICRKKHRFFRLPMSST